MATPSTQKAGERPISFTLQDLSNGNDITSIDLVIRPEELTRSEPSRLSTQQTLGGAWADNFGEGIKQVSINGHTGWRGGISRDGMAIFRALNDTVFAQWHEKRARAVEKGRDPEDIKLIFADALDDFVYVVGPTQFTLRRSKSRPLLMQYQISLAVLATNVDNAGIVLAPPAILPGSDSIFGGLGTLREILGNIRGYATDIDDFIDGTLGTTARQFMEMTADVLDVTVETVDSLGGSIDVVAGSLISVAGDLAQAGRNVMGTLAAVQSLPNLVRQRLMEVSGAYSYALCILRNALRAQDTYPDYSDWYGASNCSALTGGRPASPLRFENPFYRLNDSQRLPVTQTDTAREATAGLVALDVIEADVDTDIAARVGDIVAGTTVEAA